MRNIPDTIDATRRAFAQWCVLCDADPVLPVLRVWLEIYASDMADRLVEIWDGGGWDIRFARCA